MKYIITERQYKLLTEDKERKILRVPGLEVFGDWEGLQAYLDKKGNPLFSVSGDLYLKYTNIISLDNLVSVEGFVDLYQSEIESLGNLEYVGGDLDLIETPIQSLGNLEYVGGDLDLGGCDIESFDNLVFVGGDLNLTGTPISKMYSPDEIKEMVEVGGEIYI
jgi:hypothetical protein